MTKVGDEIAKDGKTLVLSNGDSLFRNVDRSWAPAAHAFRNQRTDNIIAAKCSITSYIYTIFLPNWRGPVTPALVP